MASISTGFRSGRLVVIGDAEPFIDPTSRDRLSASVVRCDCGTIKNVRNTSLRTGRTVSCGCIQKEKASVQAKANTKHGLSSSRVFHSWCAMRQRCYYPKHKDFHSYGGRGITVCPQWRESFEVFLSDMGQPPVGYTLDRIDTDGNYCPENCQWADAKTQANSQKKTHKILLRGEILSLSEACRRIGRNPCVAVGIAKRKAISIQESLDLLLSGVIKRNPKKRKL